LTFRLVRGSLQSKAASASAAVINTTNLRRKNAVTKLWKAVACWCDCLSSDNNRCSSYACPAEAPEARSGEDVARCQGRAFEQQKLDCVSSKECTPTVITSTSSAANGKLCCESEGMKSTATFDVEARDQEHRKGSSHGSIAGNGQTMKIDSAFTSKWLGSTCG